MRRYNPKEIEPRWQQRWESDGIYRATEDKSKPKKYVLEYFPYPSGAAMHVGHVRNYTIGDAIARYNRMQGKNVLHPMGWDAFGLPAENYAIKTNTSPQDAIKANTSHFKQQLMQMGFSYDWSREINSTDPDYYKWTQWFFLLLFRNGLAYQQNSLQWWCPFDKTVLANEQVEAGKCWRCGHDVEKKALKQWFFKITAYADRLLEDLGNLDWSDSIKSMQRNWIGRSKGATIQFKVDGQKDLAIEVFTTRPDTLYGATFLVLAPEHPLVSKLTTKEHKSLVNSYLKSAEMKSDIERQDTNREKTGVFSGSYAVNPVSRQRIPIWIADYVIIAYGTGAIMAVPGHDERDYQFAKKFKLPIKYVVEPSFGEKREVEDQRDAIVALVRNPNTNQVILLDWGPRLDRSGGMCLIGGGKNRHESDIAAALREIKEETGYQNLKLVKQLPYLVHNHYYSNVKRRDYFAHIKGLWFDLIDDQRTDQKLDADEKALFEIKWVGSEEARSLVGDDAHRYILEALLGDTSFHDEGVMADSGKYDGQASSSARDEIIEDLTKAHLGEEVVNYKMRDWLISRQRYWGAPIPIIHCPTDGVVPVPEEQLPVLLPELESIEPSGDGRSPLAKDSAFVNVICPKCGGSAQRETDTMDGFACSSWYFLRFADPHNLTKPFSRPKADFWLPVDDYIGGAEHAVMHLLYARFWTKVMRDQNLIDFEEPFLSLRNQGMILAPDGAKMSKSKGNTIEPDGLIEQGYGADAVRIMELFIGPWDQAVAWSVDGMGGAFRFLQRVWFLTLEWVESAKSSQTDDQDQVNVVIHKAIKKISQDMEGMGFNTAVAFLMETVNQLYKIKSDQGYRNREVWHSAIENLLKLLAPFAPHITEELWHIIGNPYSIHQAKWPSYDDRYLIEDNVRLAVQINGKLRAEVLVPVEADEKRVLELAAADSGIKPYLQGKNIKRKVYVPGRVVNFVI